MYKDTRVFGEATCRLFILVFKLRFSDLQVGFLCAQGAEKHSFLFLTGHFC